MILDPTAMSVSQVARRLPSRTAGKSLNPSTVARWVTHGCKRSDGSRVRLEAIRIGYTLLVTETGLAAFLAALAAPAAIAEVVA